MNQHYGDFSDRETPSYPHRTDRHSPPRGFNSETNERATNCPAGHQGCRGQSRVQSFPSHSSSSHDFCEVAEAELHPWSPHAYKRPGGQRMGRSSLLCQDILAVESIVKHVLYKQYHSPPATIQRYTSEASELRSALPSLPEYKANVVCPVVAWIPSS